MLPNVLRDNFQENSLPDWVCSLINVPPQSTFQSFKVTENLSPDERKALQQFLFEYFRKKCQSKKFRNSKLNLDSAFELTDAELDQIELSVRAKNSLLSFFSDRGLISWNTVTYQDLLSIPNCGLKTVYEIVCRLSSECNLQTEKMRSTPAEQINFDLEEDIWDRDWSNQVFFRDRRFRDLNFLTSSDLTTPLSTVISTLLGEGSNRQKLQAKKLAKIGSERCAEISSMTLDDSLKNYLAAHLKNPRNEVIETMLQRFGWHGDEPTTLESASEIMGVTRERVRQIEKSLKDNLPLDLAVYMPALDDAINLMFELDGSSELEYIEKIVSTGISNIGLVPNGIKIAAMLCGRDYSELGSKKIGNERIVTATGTRFKAILSRSRRLSSRNGLVSIPVLIEDLISENISIDETALKNFLSAQQSLTPIDEHKNYWLEPQIGGGRNRLINTIKKILSVTSRVPIDDIREAVRRAYKWRNSHTYKNDPLIPPTKTALIGFLKFYNIFKVNEDMTLEWAGIEPLNFRDILGSVDLALVEAFRKSPSGFLSRNEILDSAVGEAGINESSIQVFTTYSPIVQRVCRHVYKIIGSPIDAAAIAVHLAKPSLNRPSSYLTKTHFTWVDGKLLLATRVPKYNANMVVNCPSQCSRYFAGREFNAVTESGRNVGTVKYSDKFAGLYGLSKYCNAQDMDDEDVLAMEFNLRTEEVLLTNESIDYLEQFE